MVEDAELEAISQALARADADPWTPRCVAEAFLGEPLVVGGWVLGALTLGGWLRLEAVRSPFVTGEFPESLGARVAALAFALGVMSGEAVGVEDVMDRVSGTEAAAVEESVARWIHGAFATALPMHRPSKAGEPPLAPVRDHGFGWWVRVFTKLVSELRLAPADALNLPLAQAFALLATQALLDGCEPTEMNWKEREAVEGGAKDVPSSATGRRVEGSGVAAGGGGAKDVPSSATGVGGVFPGVAVDAVEVVGGGVPLAGFEGQEQAEEEEGPKDDAHGRNVA